MQFGFVNISNHYFHIVSVDQNKSKTADTRSFHLIITSPFNCCINDHTIFEGKFHPDKVKINEIGGTQTLIIELSVEKSDIGKIIGKKGKTINAIRTLLMSVASRNGIRVNLEILEDGVPRQEDEV